MEGGSVSVAASSSHRPSAPHSPPAACGRLKNLNDLKMALSGPASVGNATLAAGRVSQHRGTSLIRNSLSGLASVGQAVLAAECVSQYRGTSLTRNRISPRTLQ